MFTSIFVYGPGSGSETLELWIRIRQKFRILADLDLDPQHCSFDYRNSINMLPGRRVIEHEKGNYCLYL
jgi:hypothetical protein